MATVNVCQFNIFFFNRRMTRKLCKINELHMKKRKKKYISNEKNIFLYHSDFIRQNSNMALPNHRIYFSASDWGRMEDVFTNDILFTNQPTPEPVVIDDKTDEETIMDFGLDSPSRTASQTSTLDLQLISDETLDELFIDADSHPELTHNSVNEVNWRNVVSVSQYIRDLQLPGGVDGRIYSPQLPAHPRYSRRQWNNMPVPTADMLVEVKSVQAPVRDKGEYFLMFAVIFVLCFLAYLSIKCLNTMDNWVANKR